MAEKLQAGGALPEIELPKVGGGMVSLGGSGSWQVIVVYRGRHCPLCKPYLKKLEELKPGFEGLGASVMAISADGQEKADADVADHGWTFEVGYDLALDDMASLGLYVSEPRSEKETDRPFAEPGFFLVRPDGRTQIVDISNAPFARTDLTSFVGYLKYIQENDYPVRGTRA